MKHRRVVILASEKTPQTMTTGCKTKIFTWRLNLGHTNLLLLSSLVLGLLLSLESTSAQSSIDDFGNSAGFSRFRFAPPSDSQPNSEQPPSTAAPQASNRSSSFVWQPLPLRATFRPLNRQQSGASSSSSSSPTPPQPPTAPRAPRPPAPPSPPPPPPPPPEPLALISERSVSNSDSATDNLFPSNSGRSSSGSSSFPSSSSFGDDFFTPSRLGDSLFSSGSSSFFQPSTTTANWQDLTTTTTTTSTTTTTTTTTTTPTPPFEVDEDTPTRQPMNRFRPTKAPAEETLRDNDTPTTGGANLTTAVSSTSGRMSSECFECICEASTNCNARSRCQTSDVRHTRCGMFLISYDQWVATGLSRELVTREALARDAAADERAFYDCVTQRECAERLLAIYMQRNQKDCDRDGRVDCYDYAAIHHSGLDQCASEQLLDSQYWTDFNACLGFGR